MDRVTAIFVDGIGSAAATSGILNQLQGRIFALLYLQPQPLSLDGIAADLEQSKSNISVQIRGLVEWHLVRRVPVGGSRKDHYEAATDFWRLMQEILERRHRFSVRPVSSASMPRRILRRGETMPSTCRVPWLSGRIPATSLRRVVLPAPFGPTIPKRVPSGMFKDRFLKTGTSFFRTPLCERTQ
jgi:hypothetical protein